MKAGGSLLTLTYFGAEQVMPHNVWRGESRFEASVRYRRSIPATRTSGQWPVGRADENARRLRHR